MPTFEPFRGLRYDPAGVRIDEVMAPPYDVIGSAERVTLANRSPVSSVRVELPEPDLQGGRDPYQVAAGLLADWIEDGTLLADPAPAFYPYRMTSPDGLCSTGVIGALALGTDGDGDGDDGSADDDDVLPHEETLPKARSDRAGLLRATRTNLSPVWGLSLGAGLSAAVEPTGPPVADAFDDDGVRHQLWLLDDPAAVDAVRAAVASGPLVIADGHHRYETARGYRAEVRAANGDRPGGHDLVMAFVVELAEDQLTVGPIHRTLGGLPEGVDLPAAFAPWFDVVRAGPASERVVGALGASRSLSLLTPDGAWMLTPLAGAYDAAGSDLDASLVALACAALPPHTSTHQHTWEEAFAAVTSGAAQAAVLLRPVTVGQIAEWAAARRRMPPKTTYFTPKPRTGMVFRPLDG